MRLPKFSYYEPDSQQEAIDFWRTCTEHVMPFAGGTDLLVAMKQRRKTPAYLLSLRKACPAGVKVEGDLLMVGTMTTLGQLSESPIIKEYLPALARAAYEVGSPLLRNVATIGGNICLENRCKFLNQSEFWRTSRPPCFKMGGQRCYITNQEGGPCYSTYSGDIAPLLVTLQASLRLVGVQGEDIVPVAEFFTGNGRFPNILSEGAKQIVTEVIIPLPRSGVRIAYHKYRLRESIDFPVIGLAVAVEADWQTRICKGAAIVLTGVNTKPTVALDGAAALKGRELNALNITQAVETVAAEVKVVRTDYVSPQYKRKIITAMLNEVLTELCNREGRE